MPNNTLDQEKQQLRTAVLKQRRALTPDQVQSCTAAILERLTALSAYRQARSVMLYMDYQNEVAVSQLLPTLYQQEKIPVLPLTTKTFEILPYQLVPPTAANAPLPLITNAMGIREPDPAVCPRCEAREIDFVIVPGVVFDRQGNRLGFGRGCYDQFLPQLRPTVKKVAVAYSFQIFPAVPVHAADVPMDAIITETALLPVSEKPASTPL